MQSVHEKKILVKNPEKKVGENAKKTGKIGKNAVDFSNFSKIFQSFRKSDILMPSHGKRKWRRKSGKKPIPKGFREIKNHTKNRIFEGKKILLERSLQDFRICKKLGSQSYIRQNVVI